MQEVWVSLKFDKEYEVSNQGRVKSKDRIVKRGGTEQPRKGLVLRPGKNKKTGYHHVSIRGKSYNVHRLVAEHFVPNPENLPEVNHKNTDKNDNRSENLEWMTQSDNKKHAVNNGVKFNPRPKRGEEAGAAKLTWEKVKKIRKLHKEGKHNQPMLGRMFNVTQANINCIVNNKTWKEAGLTLPKVEGQ